jgi:hypothetical protein
MDKTIMIEGEGSSTGMIGRILGPVNINLPACGTAVANTTSHWDLAGYVPPTVELILSPASKDDLIDRLMNMIFMARRDLEILQKSDAAPLPDSFTLLPLDCRPIRVKIRKTVTPQFKFIED